MTTAWTNWNTSYASDLFGPIKGGQTVQEGVYNTIQKWVPAYIAEMNRHLGSDELTIPQEYRWRPEFMPEPPDMAPRILVLSHGLVGEPERYQTDIRSTWEVEVSTYIYGTDDWQQTQALTMAYTAAIRTLLIQHGTLGTIAELTRWIGESYLEGEHTSHRTRGLGISKFEVVLHTTLDPFGGPPTPGYGVPNSWVPTVDSPEPLPLVETTTVEVTKDG